jgi:drug/metabolite transporter (DMT)-like permease
VKIDYTRQYNESQVNNLSPLFLQLRIRYTTICMWPLVIIAQVIVSSVMTITTRKLSLSNQRVFFVVGFFTYLMVALMGIVYSFVFGVDANYLPSAVAWQYIVPASVGIVTAWLLLYKAISIFGASNAVLITMANYIGTVTLGYLVLGEAISSTFVLGAMLIVISIWIAFSVRADTTRATHVSTIKKVSLVAAMAAAFSFGMMFEKLAIDTMGVWEYARYGWLMQFVCASILVAVYGRKEFSHVDRPVVNKAVVLGLLTSVAGGLYILALSLGTLSGTMLATSAKITLTSVLAYVFLHERNALGLRVLGLAISIFGMWLILR